MSTLIRTWTTVFNTVPASEASVTTQMRAVLRALKDALKSAGWSVRGSCDSVAAGMDGVDRWDSDSDLVWNTAGSAHSWFVLYKSDYPITGQSIDLLIACDNAAASPHNFTFGAATMAYSGGSTTANPTTSTGTRSRQLANRQLLNSTLTASRYHISRNTLGDVFLACSQNSTARCQGYLMVAKTVGQRTSSPADPFPFFASSGYLTGAGGGLTLANLSTVSNNIGFNPHDSLGNANTALAYLQAAAASVQSVIPSTGDAHSNQLPMFPLGIWSGSPAYQMHGLLEDIKGAPAGSGVTQGTEKPASPATSTCVLLGEIWVPNGGTTIIM